MRDRKSVPAGCGYVVTDAGRDVDDVETCNCQPSVHGSFLECARCGTVYGLLNQVSFARGPSWSDKH